MHLLIGKLESGACPLNAALFFVSTGLHLTAFQERSAPSKIPQPFIIKESLFNYKYQKIQPEKRNGNKHLNKWI